MANKYEKMSECFHNYRNAMMNYNLSSVRLEKISIVQTRAVKRVEKKILSQMIGETINIQDYLSICAIN